MSHTRTDAVEIIVGWLKERLGNLKMLLNLSLVFASMEKN